MASVYWRVCNGGFYSGGLVLSLFRVLVRSYVVLLVSGCMPLFACSFE
jgi:hypothetical protein